MVNKELPNHIEEYFKDKEFKDDFINLFECNEYDFDLKSHFTKEEIIIANIIKLNSDFLINKGFPKENIFNKFIQSFSRFRFSLDRLSRSEFVNINKKDKFEENLNSFNALTNLKRIKE